MAPQLSVQGELLLRRLHDLTIGIQKPHYFIRLNKDTKDDLQMWLKFLSFYNGITMIRPLQIVDSNSLHMFSDASKVGFGATYGTQWIQCRWPTNWSILNITIFKIYPILVFNLFVSEQD